MKEIMMGIDALRDLHSIEMKVGTSELFRTRYGSGDVVQSLIVEAVCKFRDICFWYKRAPQEAISGKRVEMMTLAIERLLIK